MKHFLIFLIGIFLYIDCDACRCPHEKRDSTVHKALINSDLIFTGELIDCNIDDLCVLAYKFKIIELFKGDYSKDIINGCITGMCSVLPQEQGLWIVYANQINDSTIEIDNCSPTISLSKTKILIPPSTLFPEFENQTEDSLIVKSYQLRKKIEGLTFWLSDLEKLRKYKREHTVLVRKYDLQTVLFIFLILINIILIFTIIKLRKK